MNMIIAETTFERISDSITNEIKMEFRSRG